MSVEINRPMTSEQAWKHLEQGASVALQSGDSVDFAVFWRRYVYYLERAGMVSDRRKLLHKMADKTATLIVERTVEFIAFGGDNDECH